MGAYAKYYESLITPYNNPQYSEPQFVSHKYHINLSDDLFLFAASFYELNTVISHENPLYEQYQYLTGVSEFLK